MNFAEEMRAKAKAVVEEAERVKDVQIVEAAYKEIDDFIQGLASKGGFSALVCVAHCFNECDFGLTINDVYYVVDGVMNPQKAVEKIVEHYRNQGFTVEGKYGEVNISWLE